MNRRDFLRRGAMTVVAASVAPAAALSLDKFAFGGVVNIDPEITVLHCGESILPKALADYYQIRWPVSNPMFGRLELYNCEISDLKANDGSAIFSPANV